MQTTIPICIAICNERIEFHVNKLVTGKNRGMTNMGRKKALAGFTFILPWLAGFLALFLFPLVRTVLISFGQAGTNMFSVKITGFQHYLYAFTEDIQFLPRFFVVVRDTFVNTCLIIILSFYISTLLNRKIKGRGIFRVICFLPVMLGTGFVMQLLLNQNVDSSSINTVKELLLPKEVVMYLGPDITNAVLFFLDQLTVILWHSGVQILIFLSGLQSIPSSLYEAATVDSATEWESLWFITMPMMAPMFLLNIVYTIVDSFNDSGNQLSEHIRRYATEYGGFQEYAAAMGCIYLTFVLLVVGIVFICFRRSMEAVKA